MMTYLKHVGGKKHSDLKTKTIKEIQVLYERLKRQDQNFVAIGSAKDERQIKELNKDPKKKKVIKETLREEDTSKVPTEQEVTEQGTKKRKSGHVKMIARKRPRPQPDNDSDDEHRKCLRIITFESTIDSEIMETESFIARWLFARVVAKLLSRLRGVMVIQVEDSMVASNRDHVVGGLVGLIHQCVLVLFKSFLDCLGLETVQELTNEVAKLKKYLKISWLVFVSVLIAYILA
ncbi:hypothetical protein Tco_0956928 [Tanacetum coccineum]